TLETGAGMQEKKTSRFRWIEHYQWWKNESQHEIRHAHPYAPLQSERATRPGKVGRATQPGGVIDEQLCCSQKQKVKNAWGTLGVGFWTCMPWKTLSSSRTPCFSDGGPGCDEEMKDYIKSLASNDPDEFIPSCNSLCSCVYESFPLAIKICIDEFCGNH
uniref:hypothetical protein n=1 Tax=Thalassoglobus sp. TaxID=2795869 RepID=UPI003AA9D200